MTTGTDTKRGSEFDWLKMIAQEINEKAPKLTAKTSRGFAVVVPVAGFAGPEHITVSNKNGAIAATVLQLLGRTIYVFATVPRRSTKSISSWPTLTPLTSCWRTLRRLSEPCRHPSVKPRPSWTS